MDIRIDLGHPAGHEIAVFLADIKRKEDSDGADILVFAKQDPQPEMMLILRAQRQFEYMSVFFFIPLQIVHLPFVQQLLQTRQIIRL